MLAVYVSGACLFIVSSAPSDLNGSIIWRVAKASFKLQTLETAHSGKTGLVIFKN